MILPVRGATSLQANTVSSVYIRFPHLKG